MPNASAASRRSGVTTAWEKYGGTAFSRVSIEDVVRPGQPFAVGCAPEQKRSGSDSAGHNVAFEHPFVSR